MLYARNGYSTQDLAVKFSNYKKLAARNGRIEKMFSEQYHYFGIAPTVSGGYFCYTRGGIFQIVEKKMYLFPSGLAVTNLNCLNLLS